MSDSAGVAERLWDDWLPSSVRSVISEAAGGERAGRRLAAWLAAVHDLGKATPAFAKQVRVLADVMERNGLAMPSIDYESRKAPHSYCSHILLERWLVDAHGWDRAVAGSYAVVPGGHHGVPPTSDLLYDLRSNVSLLGDTDAWRDAQSELADYAVALAGAAAELPRWKSRPLPAVAQSLLTAIVIVSDWIASGELFRFGEDARNMPTRVQRAWAALDLRGSWHAVSPSGTASEQLANRFGLPDSVRARPIQEAALDLVDRLDGPGLLVVEAPMGEGKTELALMCAEIMANRTGAGGLFYGLPTMATSDGIFPRVHSWVDALPDARGEHQSQTAYLAHGKARLNKDFQRLARVGTIDFLDGPRRGHVESDEAMVAHTWLSGRKKGLLANFVVGTIDQALFAVLKSKHVVLRHLALANKVVVIDEVHASDSYMKVYLRRLLRWLGAYGVPTVLMSATLQPADRADFAKEYARARPKRVLAGRRRRQTVPEPPNVFDELQDQRGYPLLTTVTPGGQVRCESAPASGRGVSVVTERIDDDLDTLVARLRVALADGGAVGIIRNTVTRAQRTAVALRAAFPEADVVLSHARFVSRDRLETEKHLRDVLGPPRAKEDRVRFGDRPLIVVGTQVLEQSLDIDFDLLVTDLAPVDLLLQRVGRLHRHERDNRAPRLATPRLLLTGADWRQDPPEPVTESAKIYGDRSLLAAVAVLDSCTDGTLSLPGDIARLVAEAADANLTVPETWRERWQHAELKRLEDEAASSARAKTFLLPEPDTRTLIGALAALSPDDDDSEGHAQVRDADASIEVIVVQRVGDEVRVLPSVPGEEAPVIPVELWGGDRTIEYAVSSCTLRLPRTFTAAWRIDRVIRELERNRFDAWQQSPLLRGELALVLDQDLRGEIDETPVCYDHELGLLMGDDARRA